MAHPIKLASCCYCGRRTVLRPTARDGHELACGSCGAPLHEMKALKIPQDPAPKAAPSSGKSRPQKPEKPKKIKKRKPFWIRALSELIDEIEDIFD